ncbi:histidine ammonia-lyase [Roseivivax halodurans JCM 10272]|uniref:Histidine ammonia-lyase n=1 Tax=Roseivivax halodurans JCM 10272 TaxID=1449350 RepID=X7EIZ4_9RHOB|nr:aromatic amino acid ammonia-lyase [Roseivivax halodurans]ETX15862.1 histidine ammonia-lyase [Roseivivax halodurans JCM 10272]
MAFDRALGIAPYDFAGTLDLGTANDIAEGRVTVRLGPEATARCHDGHARLRRIISERRHVYGLTTGYGPLADRLVAKEDGIALQQNLIHHLATGLGPSFGWATARAIVLCRLAAISRGLSGAAPQTTAALIAVLNSDLAPAIPERGTVGASGDLTPLAHMVLCLQGRGAFLTVSGEIVEASDALARIGIVPLDISGRDGLALVNGTSAMTGVALRTARISGRLCSWELGLSAALSECLGGRAEAWDATFAEARPHPGQGRATADLQARIAGSARMRWSYLAERSLGDARATRDEIAQDAYTLRCVPQIVGAVIDTLDWHDGIVTTELNSVTDNPILPAAGPVPALHGGNFMGQHVGLASDALATALTVLAGLAERQIARLTDERLNRGLPAFLHGGRAGLHSGLMGAQVTATALVAEMRSAGPASTQSISTNGANQDVVSMGTIAARRAHEAALRGSEVLAILALAVAQAIDLRMREGGAPFSRSAEALHRVVRSVSPILEEDRPLAEDIAAMAAVLRERDCPSE